LDAATAANAPAQVDGDTAGWTATPDPAADDRDVTVTLQLGRPTHIAGLTIGSSRNVGTSSHL